MKKEKEIMAAARQSPFESVTINLEHDIDEQYQYQPGEIIRGKIGKFKTLILFYKYEEYLNGMFS